MTILFKQDWFNENGRPRAIVQDNTKNTSFLRMHMLLTNMGISNNLFFLSLYDPALKNIDPHELDDDNDPTLDLRFRVAVECKRNVWYFLREVVRIPASGGDAIPFELHRGNLAMTWCFFAHVDYNGTQPRQTGKDQPLDSKILTPTGWKTMGDMETGVEVVTPDGGTATVTGVFPQGYKDVYEVVLHGGSSARCGLGHLWSVRIGSPTASDEVLELKDIIALHAKTTLYIPKYDEVTRTTKYYAISSITHVSHEQTQCIMIDHPDHLYITDDFIVTHNTICAVTLSTYVVYILGVNMKVIMLTHCDDLVQENVKRVKDIRDHLPPYLLLKSGADIDNKSGLDYKALKNVYDTRVGQKDKIAANKLGRGSSAPMLHIDELAFIPNIQITFPAIMASTNTVRQHARLAGMPYTNLYTTTAGDPMTTEGKFAHEIVKAGMKFTERLYDTVDMDSAHRMVAMNSENGLVNGTFSYLQLGKTHEWFKETIRRNNVPPDEIARDYLNQWISLAKNPIVSKDLLAIMEATKKPDPDFTEVYGDYIINWYIPRAMAKSSEYRRKILIMGMDGAEGVGRDFTTFVCVDPKTLQTIFTFRCNDSNTTRIGLLVDKLLSEYTNMLFVPERKNSGVFITDMVVELMLQRGVQPLTRIFNKIVDQKDKNEFKEINVYDPEVSRSTKRRFIGFMTTETTRTTLYKSVLQRAALQGCKVVYDTTLINELSGLQATGGRIDHKSKEHDDMVIAWLLACYVIFEGRNLQYYGISEDDLPRPVDSEGQEVNQSYIDAQMEVRKAIRELELKLRMAGTQWQKENIRYQIRKLAQYLDDSVTLEPVSVDAVRRDTAEYRSAYRRGDDAPLSGKQYDLGELVNCIKY